MRIRDPLYADGVDRSFAAQTGVRAASLAPPPVFTPVEVGSLHLPNRIAVSPAPRYTAADGVPGEEHRADLVRAAETGAALVLTEIVAVVPQGRITSGDLGLWSSDHAGAWARILDEVHRGGTRVGLPLGHAGRRGSTRQRQDGLDRPLPQRGWDLVSASAMPYRPDGPVPRELDRDGMSAVAAAFATAAELAASAGFDFIEIHMGHGYLLGSFLSPLTNVRSDGYGGSLDRRMRFPLEVVEAVRDAWPSDRPLAAAINATDWEPGGVGVEDAVVVARALSMAGCDLVEAAAGYTTPSHRPHYGRLFLVPFADRIRNEARVPTLVGGGITTTGQANTVLAGGRADVVLMDLPS